MNIRKTHFTSRVADEACSSEAAAKEVATTLVAAQLRGLTLDQIQADERQFARLAAAWEGAGAAARARFAAMLREAGYLEG